MEIDQIINEPIFTIMDNKGRVLLSIPRKIGIQDYTVEELFELIAEQTRAFNGEQIAREIEGEGPWCDNPYHRKPNERLSGNNCPCYLFAIQIARGQK